MEIKIDYRRCDSSILVDNLWIGLLITGVLSTAVSCIGVVQSRGCVSYPQTGGAGGLGERARMPWETRKKKTG
jgi:hypothetical protein